MSDQPDRQISTAWDESAARAWIEGGMAVDELEAPWRLAATIVSQDHPDAALVLDAASGPGGFLGVMLETLPSAQGVWLDFSETMLAEAQTALSGFGDRVRYVVGDLVEIDRAGQPGTFDAVTTSRATHHLRVPDLYRFYELAAGLLRPGGWIANLDNAGFAEPWATRLRNARRVLREANGPVAPRVANHPHPFPGPLISDHLAALQASGFVEAEVIWSSPSTASAAPGRNLIMARLPDGGR